MFLRTTDIAPVRIAGLISAAEAAARSIPPAFPLPATVAVNPFLGQAGEPPAVASARLARTCGIRLFPARSAFAAMLDDGRIRDDDLASALAAADFPSKPASLAALRQFLAHERPAPEPAPTLADIAARRTGTDWPSVIARTFGAWAAGHFDQGQALWSAAPGRGAFLSWREWASRDLTPEIAGLGGFCRHVAEAPDTPERAILRACERLELSEGAAVTVFHRLLADLGGWAQHARWLLWEAERNGSADHSITDLLAVRMIWEEALLASAPDLAGEWAEVCAMHAEPVRATRDDLIDAIFQEAAERAHQRRLQERLSGPAPREGRASLQAAFCIDVRSEVFRRALEGLDGSVETIGFAGFFGLPLAHRDHGTNEVDNHLPVLLNPAVTATSHRAEREEVAARIRARTERAWGRFRQAAVSSFAFVEAAGPAYAWKLMRDALGLGGRRPSSPGRTPEIDMAMTAARKAELCAGVLRAMSLTHGHARLVLLIGHGANVCNNPHESAYHCGACGGLTGEVSARVLARLLNEPETRAALAELGVVLPEDTLFLAGLHDTTTDAVTLYEDALAPAHAADIIRARTLLSEAGALARAERAPRLPGASPSTIAGRARNWAEVRPEWGLAGCAAFIAAPRAATCGADLGGRAFLHSYDWRQDTDFSVLELIITAPVVVASWISLQYYGSALAPEVFGGGDKLIHNVVGGIGVLQGNGGRLRPGLPWQAVHDGRALVHEPLRLSVLIEAPSEAIAGVLARNPAVRDLFDHGWLHLLVLEEGRIAARYRPGLAFERAPGRMAA